ncbi:hypothetical protein VN1336_01110 [Helicobacter pylori]
MPSFVNLIHTNASALNSGAKKRIKRASQYSLKAKENLKSLKNEFQGFLNGKMLLFQ